MQKVPARPDGWSAHNPSFAERHDGQAAPHCRRQRPSSSSSPTSNGSGSASANELFARSCLRMGVPVSPRNIFPSNIQGLPHLVRGARERAARLAWPGAVGRRHHGGDEPADLGSGSEGKIEPGWLPALRQHKTAAALRSSAPDINAIGISAHRDRRREVLPIRASASCLKNIMYVGRAGRDARPSTPM